MQRMDFHFACMMKRKSIVVFVHEPYAADSREAVRGQCLKNYVVTNTILNLRFKKVYIMPCFKEKLLVPGAFFDKANIATLYTVNQEVSPDDTILYHHIEGIEAYLVETVISSFHGFVSGTFSRGSNRKWGIPFYTRCHEQGATRHGADLPRHSGQLF